jgi:S-adenosylmethionine:tRNA ribosyltransferase-isomerase
MNDPRQLRIEDFTYQLPDNRIATHPLPERDSSKLLIFRDGNISEGVYNNISAHIPGGTLMVFNETKVVHARLLFHKATGGVIEVFCLEPHEKYPDVQTAMLQQGSVWWKCLVGGASKWKHGMVLSEQVEAGGFTLKASIAERGQGSFTIELSWDKEDLTFAEVLHNAGKVPLPPYIHGEANADDEERYQTVYAKQEGSVAAPTAGLHFTANVLEGLRQKNISLDFVTLHVGAGTFKPVKSDTMLEHDMHAEWIDVDIRTIENLCSHLDKGIVAVGTTSLRTLESLYWIGVKLLEHMVPDLSGIAVHQWDPYELKSNIPAAHALKALTDWMLQGHIERLVTRTQILIAPGYEFKIIRGLVTNFHQPQSTLLLLVAALIGEDWRKAYDYALEHQFRFLSYGDGSLLWAGQLR